MEFDEIVDELRPRLVQGLQRQFESLPGAATFIDEFVSDFDRVEYTLNTRLLHTLARIPATSLHRLVASLAQGGLRGSELTLAVDVERESPDGRQEYHVAQDDGLLVGDGAVVAIEIKAAGKARRSSLDAAQLAKHAWMLSKLKGRAATAHDRLVLAVVPQRDGRHLCLSSDVRRTGSGGIEPGESLNRPFHDFARGIDPGPGASERVLAATRAQRTTLVSYDELADAAQQVLIDGTGPNAQRVERSFRRIADLAAPVL